MNDKDLYALRYSQGWNAYADNLVAPFKISKMPTDQEQRWFDVGLKAAEGDRQQNGLVRFLLEELEERMSTSSDLPSDSWIRFLRLALSAYKEERRK